VSHLEAISLDLVDFVRQAQGVSFVANYTVITLIGLGIQNVYVIVLVLYIVLLISSLGAFYFPDKFGRRTRKLLPFRSGSFN